MSVGVTASSVSLALTPSRRKRHRRIHGQSRRSRPYRHRYGGFYCPWIYFNDVRTGARTKVLPGGSICGIYSRSDNTRGVCKAPVNETVAGALDLEFDMDQGGQEILNLSGVNVIRQSPGCGIRVWGAQALSSDP